MRQPPSRAIFVRLALPRTPELFHFPRKEYLCHVHPAIGINALPRAGLHGYAADGELMESARTIVGMCARGCLEHRLIDARLA
jgi:hypothetical protein